jgi:glutathione peroxidase
LFRYLTKALPGTFGKRVKWNFTKFLIGPNGKPVKRFAPSDSPLSMRALIEELLTENNSTAVS